MQLSKQQKAAIEAAITDPRAAKALISVIESAGESLAATSVEVQEDVLSTLIGGDLQAVLQDLASRIAALEA